MHKRLYINASSLALMAIFVIGATALTLNWPPARDKVFAQTVTPTYSSAPLTVDGLHTIRLTSSPTNLFLDAPGTDYTANNYRAAIWSSASTNSLNQESCATWVGETEGMNQQGVAVRIVNNGTTTRAITITKNVIYGVHWSFNAHVWDSSKGPDAAFTSIGQFDKQSIMFNEIGKVKYMPWRVCLRAVNSTLTFKIWFPNSMSEPSWTDTRYTGTTTIPAAYNVPGRAGWYGGHIRDGGNVQYTNLTTRAL